MDAAQIKAWVNRDWEMVEQMKTRRWLDLKTGIAPSAVFRLAQELRDYTCNLRPDWPSPAERQADLAEHIRLSGILKRVRQNSIR